jgi:hypothetical protein
VSLRPNRFPVRVRARWLGGAAEPPTEHHEIFNCSCRFAARSPGGQVPKVALPPLPLRRPRQASSATMHAFCLTEWECNGDASAAKGRSRRQAAGPLRNAWRTGHSPDIPNTLREDCPPQISGSRSPLGRLSPFHAHQNRQSAQLQPWNLAASRSSKLTCGAIQTKGAYREDYRVKLLQQTLRCVKHAAYACQPHGQRLQLDRATPRPIIRLLPQRRAVEMHVVHVAHGVRSHPRSDETVS